MQMSAFLKDKYMKFIEGKRSLLDEYIAYKSDLKISTIQVYPHRNVNVKVKCLNYVSFLSLSSLLDVPLLTEFLTLVIWIA